MYICPKVSRSTYVIQISFTRVGLARFSAANNLKKPVLPVLVLAGGWHKFKNITTTSQGKDNVKCANLMKLFPLGSGHPISSKPDKMAFDNRQLLRIIIRESMSTQCNAFRSLHELGVHQKRGFIVTLFTIRCYRCLDRCIEYFSVAGCQIIVNYEQQLLLMYLNQIAILYL